jgi:WD40 repeat protein
VAYVEYTNGSQLLVFYGTESKTATVYRVDDWVQVTDETITNFEFAPGLVEGFKDDKYEGSLIYANSQGNIRRKSFTKKGAIDFSLWTIKETTRNIRRVIPSPDSKLYAAFCSLATVVYLGDLSVAEGLIEKIETHQEGGVTSICWRPGTSQLIISGGNPRYGYQLSYDAATKTLSDITFNAGYTLGDIVCSPDGSSLYYIDNHWALFFLYRYDFKTNTTEELLKEYNNKLDNLRMHGNHLSLYNTTIENIWDSRTREYDFTEYSRFLTTGLSPDEATAVKIPTNDDAQFYIFKICPEEGESYDTQTDTCKKKTSQATS